MNPSRSFPVLRLIAPNPQHAEAPLTWVAFNEQGLVLDNGCDTIENLPEATHTELVIPARHISALAVNIPPAAGRHTKQIITQALDDYCLGTVASLHFVQGERIANTVLIWALERDWLTQSLAILQTQGREYHTAIAEYMLLPPSSDNIHFAQGQDYCYFRDSQGQFSCIDNASTLALLYPEQNCVEIIEPLKGALLASKVNLLSGDFSKKTALPFSWQDYKKSALLIAILLLVLLAQQVFHWQALSQRNKQLKQDIRQTFATVFPGTPIIDPVAQWQQKFSQAHAQFDALDLASFIADNLQVPIHPHSMDIHDGSIRLVISEQESSLLRGALEKNGHTFEFSPADSGTVRVEIRVQR